MTKKKIQLVLDEQAQETLAALVESTGAESMAHVLRDALGVYSTLHEMLTAKTGLVLSIVDHTDNTIQALNIPSMNRARVLAGERRPIGGTR